MQSKWTLHVTPRAVSVSEFPARGVGTSIEEAFQNLQTDIRRVRDISLQVLDNSAPLVFETEEDEDSGEQTPPSYEVLVKDVYFNIGAGDTKDEAIASLKAGATILATHANEILRAIESGQLKLPGNIKA